MSRAEARRARDSRRHGIERDLVPIALVGEQPFTIVANNTLGVTQ